jgi:hypothetical protein
MATIRTNEDRQIRLRSLPERGDNPESREEITFLGAGMAELALLLPSGQAAVLLRLAHERGITVGQLLRCLIRDYLTTEELEYRLNR